jgi:hypothetical protein
VTTYKGVEFQPPVSARMLGLAAAIAGTTVANVHPTAVYVATRRADYRQPYRAQMLADAKLWLLLTVDAPQRIHHLARVPMRDWQDKTRAQVRARLSELCPVA